MKFVAKLSGIDKAKEKICPVKLSASDIKGIYRLIVEEYNKEVQRRFFKE